MTDQEERPSQGQEEGQRSGKALKGGSEADIPPAAHLVSGKATGGSIPAGAQEGGTSQGASEGNSA